MLLSSHEAFPTKHCLTNPVQIRVLCPGSCKAYMHLNVRTQEFAYMHKKKRSLGKKINKDPLYIVFTIFRLTFCPTKKCLFDPTIHKVTFGMHGLTLECVYLHNHQNLFFFTRF
jgi:hypothetical protein